jgi:apolipoprotein N-acyltransferase
VNPALPALVRAAWLAVAFALLYAASPGILTQDALWPLAVVGVACWARYASAAGRFAVAIEFVAGGLGGCGFMSWAAYVYEGSLVFIGVGFGLYFVAQGWALRRLAARFPLALAAPLAWLLFETLRAVLEPPFGIQWMRLGTHLHASEPIRGAARVFGFGGLSWVLAALGGALADAWGRRRPLAGAPKRSDWLPSALFGIAPAAIAVLAALFVPAPLTVDGPRLLLVQPAVEQARKMSGDDSEGLMREQLELTRLSFEEAARAGEPVPDLVAWGESMYRYYAVGPEVEAAAAAGASFAPWRGQGWPPDFVRLIQSNERFWVEEQMFGAGRARGRGAAPAGTAFVSGVEYIAAIDGALRIKNSVVLWPGPGQPRRGPASKIHRVPGAETMLGLEKLAWVRDTIHSIAGYVPDLASAEGDDSVLAFEARDGRNYRFGASVCFDNAFDDVFLEPVRSGDVDFNAVFSNEAWFELSQEADQMMAFSHLAAIASGRSVVRVTQSGITAVIAPDGREVARLEVGGRSKMVEGTLRATVPVPAGAARSPFEAAADAPPRPPTPFVRFERLWTSLWLAAGALALISTRRKAAK